MKPRHNRLFPRTFNVCIAPLIACASASAALIPSNERNATGVWNLPPGTNLLAAATATPSAASTHEGSSNSWNTVKDGALGAADAFGASVTPNNGESVTFALDLTSAPTGHNITSFDSYCTWPNSGRDNQNFTIEYSTVSNPTTFLPLATVDNRTVDPDLSTHTSLTDTTGFLALNVHSVKFTFANQENGYVGYREFVLRASTNPLLTINESNSTNIWPLPAGINLLKGANATDPTAPVGANHGNGDITSGQWATLTNSTLGSAGSMLDSVAPNNNTSVIFPLNTTVNTKGYNISSFDFYAAWPNSGRDNQDFFIRYSTVENPGVFLPLTSVSNHTTTDFSTHTRINAASGFIATGVAALQFNFDNQENGYVGYREFIALGSATSVSDPLTWLGTGGPNLNGSGNWKKTVGGAAAPYAANASLTFDSAPTNRTVNVPDGVGAFSMTFTNDATHPYTVGGELLVVANDIVSTGAGTVTFNNAVETDAGITLSGAGNLIFNNSVAGPGLILTGSGGITLNSTNDSLNGTIGVSNGILTVADDFAIQYGALQMTGGTTRFTSPTPVVATLSGTGGTVVLGTTSASNLFVGDFQPVTSFFSGTITNNPSHLGSLTKVGTSNLVLSGTNTYTGPTLATGSGSLQFDQRVSLYGGLPANWTAQKLLASSGGTLAFRAGGTGEFTEAEINAMPVGGFEPNSYFGIVNSTDLTLSRNLTQTGLGLLKSGSGILTLTGTNTSNGVTRITGGTIKAANPGGPSIGGNVLLDAATDSTYLNMAADNQFGPTSVISMTNGSFYNTKVNLRGTSQTLAGLEGNNSNRVSLIQNDEVGMPGFTVNPGPASLTLNTSADHSFAGIIRDQDGGPVSLIKNGNATQELVNIPAQSYSYSGPTTINAGRLRLNFAGGATGFGSNISIGATASLEFRATGGNYAFERVISGAGPVLVTGTNAVVLRNGTNSYSGGTTVDGGFLALDPNVATGPGTGPGQTCVAGEMIPSNKVLVTNSATLSLDATAALGQASVLPQFAPSVQIDAGSALFGGTNTVAFVSNLTLNGGNVIISTGAGTGDYNTNLAFVGTVIVSGGPARIFNAENATGEFANASLGSTGLPGTTFQVADVTGSPAADLTVESILRNVRADSSPLVKTGPGTMLLTGANTYTGDTTVTAGVLGVTGNSIANTNKLVINGGKVDVATGANEVVKTLVFGTVQQATGTYGSTDSAATFKDNSRFSGTGIVTVDPSGSLDPYDAWASVIPNAADRDKTDDPDGDGFTNLQEYLLGGSPIAGTGSLTQTERVAGGLIIRWAERASGAYVLQEGTSLTSWATSLVVPTTSANQTGLYSSDYVRKEALVPVDVTKKFVRIKATLP